MPTKTFTGESSGPSASIDEALQKALSDAQGSLNKSHFDWKLLQIKGDFGGIVGKNIAVKIQAK